MTAIRQTHLHGLYMGHWAGNLGDSAVFDVFDQALPPTVRFTLEVHTPGDWRRRPQTQFIDFRDNASCAAQRQDCDAAIILGGTIVTDMHGGEWPIAELVESVATVKRAGKPVFALSAGIHPTLHEAHGERFQIRFCGEIDGFSVREEASAKALRAAGVGAARITVAPDLAWGLARPVDLAAARAEMSKLGGAGPPLGVNVVHEDWADCEIFYKGLAAELDEFHELTGTTTIFLCNEIRPGANFDAAAAAHVQKFMRSPSAQMPARWMHPEEMVARLSCCALAISMRYHFSIFATLAGTPWIGFARGQKLRGIMAECNGLSAGEMGLPTDGGLLAALQQCWREQTPRRAALRLHAAQMKEQVGRSLRPIQNFLSGSEQRSAFSQMPHPFAEK